jgi:hypothetical protein
MTPKKSRVKMVNSNHISSFYKIQSVKELREKVAVKAKAAQHAIQQ